MHENIDDAFSFNKLNWDSEFFGVTSAKAILKRPLSIKEWEILKNRFNDYEFVSIVNNNSEPINAQIIGKNTSAFLADINIQFKKKIDYLNEIPSNTIIHRGLERDDQVIELADFQNSKFLEDPELARRGGDKVYRQWLINSFGNSDKFFALSKDENGEINGFLLHSYSDNACVIELIAVSRDVTSGGLGTSLFKAVEYEANQRGYNEIRVGTQVRNMGAINFYHKVGCKQVGCHQVYHLWN